MKWRCKLCGKEFHEIPPDAALIAGGRRGKLYRFPPDGQLHDLVRQDPMVRHRWHIRKNTGYSDCEYCNPPEQHKLEQEKLEHERQSELAKETELSPTVGETQDNYRPRGSDPMERISPTEVESIEPEPKPASEFGTMSYAFKRSNEHGF